MYFVDNHNSLRNLKINENILSICNYISSKLQDLKKYIMQLFKKDTNQYYEEYKDNFNKLHNILRKYDIFKNEHLALFKTNNIIDYVFRNKKLTPELVEFICKVWDSFKKLLEFKLYSLNEDNNVSSEEYKSRYLLFRKEMKKHKSYFYENVFQASHDYDDFVRQLGDIILE